MKKLNLIVKSCKECPYCIYDVHFSENEKSGYYCKNDSCKATLIASDFAIYKNGWPEIPIECPLEEIKQ